MGYDWFTILTINIEKSNKELLLNPRNEYDEEIHTFCEELSKIYYYQYGPVIGFVHHTRNGMIQEPEKIIIDNIIKELLNEFPEIAFDLYTFEFDGNTRYKYTYKKIIDEVFCEVTDFDITTSKSIRLQYNIDMIRFEANLSMFFNKDYIYEDDFEIYPSTFYDYLKKN